MSGHTYKVGNSLCANVTGAPLEYGWKEMKSFSEVLDEEPWTKAKEAAALEEMRKKMERGIFRRKQKTGMMAKRRKTEMKRPTMQK